MEPKQRQLDVLRAVVSRYVETGEPVSSKTVATANKMAVSPATIRNDMGALEDAGLIYQPHTSAGRVPTEKGYRQFVDRLTELRPLSMPQRRAIEKFLSEAVGIETVIARTVRLLAQLTGTAAIAEFPVESISTDSLRRLDVIDLGPDRTLVVVVTTSGRVLETNLAMGATPEGVERVRSGLSARTANMTAAELADSRDRILAEVSGEDHELATAVLHACEDLLVQEPATRMITAGLSNLARAGSDFVDVSEVLDTIEEQVVLMRLLNEVHTGQLQVSIGAENQSERLSEASVVSASYQGVARVGVIGPTRMDYPGSLAAVEAVSRYLHRLMERG